MILKYEHQKYSFTLSVSEIKNHSLRGKVMRALEDIFRGFIISDSPDVVLDFIFTDNINKYIVDTSFVRIKDVKVGETQTYFKDNEIEFLFDNKNKYKVFVSVTDNETFKSSLKFFNKAFKNNIELQLTTFYYRVFLLFSQLWNVENDSSYIHSSSIDTTDGAILFSADSGVGKSSLLFKLSQDSKVKFIADDLTIVDSESKTFYQGRSLSVKPYHLKYYPFLSRLVSNTMSKLQSLQWRLIKDNRLTFRIPPQDLFENITKESKIKRVVHFCNHSSDIFKINDITTEDLVKRIVPILVNELFLANNRLNKVASLPGSTLNNSSILYSKVSEIYQKSFQNVELKLVLVPYKSNPNDLYNFLKENRCLD